MSKILDPIGECEICGEQAFFGDEAVYCMRHSSLINDVDPDEVIRIRKELDSIDTVERTSIQPLGFVGGVTPDNEIPWEVHEFADKNDYRVSEKELMQGGQFVLEPEDAEVPYTEIEDRL